MSITDPTDITEASVALQVAARAEALAATEGELFTAIPSLSALADLMGMPALISVAQLDELQAEHQAYSAYHRSAVARHQAHAEAYPEVTGAGREYLAPLAYGAWVRWNRPTEGRVHNQDQAEHISTAFAVRLAQAASALSSARSACDLGTGPGRYKAFTEALTAFYALTAALPYPVRDALREAEGI